MATDNNRASVDDYDASPSPSEKAAMMAAWDAMDISLASNDGHHGPVLAASLGSGLIVRVNFGIVLGRVYMFLL